MYVRHTDIRMPHRQRIDSHTARSSWRSLYYNGCVDVDGNPIAYTLSQTSSFV